MTLSMIDQSLRFSAWLIALVELVLGLYILVLNARYRANRHTSVLLLVMAINLFSMGWITGADNANQPLQPAILLAITTPAIPLLLLVTTIALAKPEWLQGRNRWAGWLVYTLALVPTLLILVDLDAGTNYWISGVPAAEYTSGFIKLNQEVAGKFVSAIRVIVFTLAPALTLLFLAYVMLFDKRNLSSTRRLAWLLMTAIAIAFLLSKYYTPPFHPAFTSLLSNAVIAAIYSITAFQNMISERVTQRGSLQARLTILMMIVSTPLLIVISVLLTGRTGAWLEQDTLPAQIALAAGALLLLFLSWITIRQAIQPIRDLTETAASIASGNLTRVAIVRSDDEIGSLARAFNSMTTQLRESIANLERRVAERTRDLERRAFQLHVAADVASQAAAIRNLEQLLDSTVRLISDRFNYYHAGIFLIDTNGKYAVLRAASSAGGQSMLAHNHKLAVGQTGIVGYVAGKGEPRIASDVDSDAIYFNNPDLPQTRSEMALPLKVRGRTIGVLDVQSTKAAAFTSEDVEVLQVLADQLAVAIDNALIHAQSEDIIRELNTLYHQQINQSWQLQLDSDDLAYSYHAGKVKNQAAPDLADPHKKNDDRYLNIPVNLRGQPLGEITLRRYDESPLWSEEEIALARQITDQIALSLENARLLEENRHRALQEVLLSQITGKTQGLLDVEAVIKTATQEIGRSLGLAKVQICLEDDSLDTNTSKEPAEALSPETGS